MNVSSFRDLYILRVDSNCWQIHVCSVKINKYVYIVSTIFTSFSKF